jgi:hypothetical protein
VIEKFLAPLLKERGWGEVAAKGQDDEVRSRGMSIKKLMVFK